MRVHARLSSEVTELLNLLLSTCPEDRAVRLVDRHPLSGRLGLDARTAWTSNTCLLLYACYFLFHRAKYVKAGVGDTGAGGD